MSENYRSMWQNPKLDLDAQVALTNLCTFCGASHVYHAGELACPFAVPE